jgi:asparagine synthase (glutamine-hydrolysing)
MCGIAGIFDLRGESRVSRPELAAMLAPISSRGPDGAGDYLDGDIGLAHARLSIIDLAGGAQPIHNEDRTVYTVFNGEIFNYLELRQQLRARGHRFYTDTDTEVIVHLYEEYGEDFVHHLNGQFAIALWDKPNRKLLLVRDRPGILPLFVAERDGRLLFGSEVKALLPLFEQAPELDLTALDQLFTFWAPLSPRTMFRGVEEVAPGEMLIVRDGRYHRRRYWDWSFPTQPDQYHAGDADTLAETLHDLMIDAVRLRLRSDVPVGAYLSGGLDSSALVALMHREVPGALRTFSIRFADAALDESAYQQRMIDFIGARHSAVRCSYNDVASRFPQAVWRAESPMLRTAPVPMSMLSELVHREGFRVVLTGEGADEVFGGYDIFKEAKLRQFWARQPESAWRPLLLKRLYPYLNLSQQQGLSYLRSFFGRNLEQAADPRFSHLPRWATTAMCKEFFADDVKSALNEDALGAISRDLPEAMSRWAPFNRAQYLEAKTLLPGYLLSSQGDRMLMANSVEGRFPFLDHRLIEFAGRLPPYLKMKALNEKYLLKQALGRYLPGDIIKRYKQPYRSPDIAAFFSGQSSDYVADLLSEDALRRSGYFSYERVARLVRKIRMGRAIGAKDNMALVGILSTQLWHHLFVERHRAQAGRCRSSGPGLQYYDIAGA